MCNVATHGTAVLRNRRLDSIQLLIVEVWPPTLPLLFPAALAVDEAPLKSTGPRRKIKRNCTCSIRPRVQLLTGPRGLGDGLNLAQLFHVPENIKYTARNVHQGLLG
jgi:hypothetical protein